MLVTVGRGSPSLQRKDCPCSSEHSALVIRGCGPEVDTGEPRVDLQAGGSPVLWEWPGAVWVHI